MSYYFMTVQVNCDLKALTMTVCYTIQDGFNFSDTATLYSNGYGDDPQCMGALGATGCDASQVGLILSLNDTDMGRCGTQLKSSSVSFVLESNHALALIIL
jgi:hypothetical protein